MKITNYQTEDERAVITAMIVSDQVLGRIHAHLKGERKPFESPECNVIAGWCLDCFSKYQKAPRKGIMESLHQWAEGRDEKKVGLVEGVLAALNQDYVRTAKGINVEQRVDTAERYFNKVRVKRLFEAGEEDLRRGDPAAALEKLADFHPVKLATRKSLALLDEKLLLEARHAEAGEVMIHYPHGLGEFFGPHLQRDGFIAFMAPEKRGKTFWLMDLAFRAVRERRRTLLYFVGDMSRNQMIRRWTTRLTRRPEQAGEILIPISIKKLKRYESLIEVKRKSFDAPSADAEIRKAVANLRAKLASQSNFIEAYCTSNSSTSVADIRADIDAHIRAGWIPDVVVIDYADILAPEPGSAKEDYRHQINVTWQALRRLSQDYHVLVVTATQSDAKSYGVRILKREHFSEDKRKLSHVTGMVGINQDKDEMRKGIFLLNWIALREGAYSEARCVHVAGCLAIANPAIVSAW